MYENLSNENKIEEIKLLQDIMNSPKKDKSIEKPATKRKLEFVEEGKALKKFRDEVEEEERLKKEEDACGFVSKKFKTKPKKKSSALIYADIAKKML